MFLELLNTESYFPGLCCCDEEILDRKSCKKMKHFKESEVALLIQGWQTLKKTLPPVYYWDCSGPRHLVKYMGRAWRF